LFFALVNCLGATDRAAISSNSDWRFLKSDAAGAEEVAFDDSGWRKLDLPHDWSIEGPFSETNLASGAGAFLPLGVSWYRKHFQLPAAAAKKRVFFEFDGVMANSDVWINGHLLGHRPNGYVSFRYELTPHVEFGDDATNVIAVRVDNERQPASRWYVGSGIYRHTRLLICDCVHLEPWSVFVTTPGVNTQKATVRIACSVTNQSDASHTVSVDVQLAGPDGQFVAKEHSPTNLIAASTAVPFSLELTVAQPQLWQLENPALYRAIVTVHSDNTPVDDETVGFGIREFHFDAANGFSLNGRNLKIKGVCLHHDGGCFGTAVPLSVWERRLATLKELGVNAIRTSHNPVAPEFLDLCDRLGFLVMDEFFDCWTVSKNPYDYHLFFNEWSSTDVRDTVRRDRNHPCIILYSTGNEIRDTMQPDLARKILIGLLKTIRENDPIRPVTQALFRPNQSDDYRNGFADLLDVVGTNYRDVELLAAHRANPAFKIIGTETGHDLRSWLTCRDNPSFAGQFLWTGIDYLGEGHKWPEIGASAGLLDRTGLIRPVGFKRQSWWSEKPMVYAVRHLNDEEADLVSTPPAIAVRRRPPVLLSDWTPRNLKPHNEEIEVFSNCGEVELVLNGRSLGEQKRPTNDQPRTWKVPFEQGTLEVLGKNEGTLVARQELKTARAAAKLTLLADRKTASPVWDDVVYVRATVTDATGIPITTASNPVSFSISGPGEIVAVDNGDNFSTEPFQARERRAYRGTCVAVVRATGNTGNIVLKAATPGLQSASVVIQTIGTTTSGQK
jgi:beta-galactosidase